jgi:hypothetical protein
METVYILISFLIILGAKLWDSSIIETKRYNELWKEEVNARKSDKYMVNDNMF